MEDTTVAAGHAEELITGSFLFVLHSNIWNMAHSDEALLWKEENWRALIRDMYNIGIDTAIWAMTAFWGRPFFPGYDSTVGHPIRFAGCPDPIKVVADEADRLGMKIFYGVGSRGRTSQVRDYAMLEKPWPDVFFSWNTAVAEALVEQHGNRPSFGGLYIPYEIDFINNTGVELYQKLVHEHLRPAVGNVDLLVSPANFGVKWGKTGLEEHDESDTDKLPGIIESTGIDIVAPQDYAGRDNNAARSIEIVELGAKVLKKVKKPIEDIGVKLWANCETFSRETRADGVVAGPHGRPVSIAGPIERITKQIALQAPHAKKLVAWNYQGIMNKRSDLVNIGHESSHKLYNDYVDYLHGKFPDRFSNI